MTNRTNRIRRVGVFLAVGLLLVWGYRSFFCPHIEISGKSRSLSLPGGPIVAADYSQEDGLVALLSTSGATVWNLSTMEQVGEVTPQWGMNNEAISVVGPSRIAIAGCFGQLQIWDFIKNELVSYKSTRSIDFNCEMGQIAMSPSGKLLASYCRDFGMNIWSVEDGTLLYRLEGPDLECGRSSPMAFSGDDRYFATRCPVKKEIAIWDLANGELYRRIAVDFEGETLYRLALSNSAEELAVTFKPTFSLLTNAKWCVVRTYCVEKLRLRGEIRFNKSQLYSVAYSPDGRAMAAGFFDGSVTLWDTETNTERRTYAPMQNHHSAMKTSFLSDGRLMVVGGYWDLIYPSGNGELHVIDVSADMPDVRAVLPSD